MAVNPLIALQAKAPNLAPMFQDFTQNRAAKLAREDRNKREDRAFDQRERQLEMQAAQARQEIERQGKMDAAREFAETAVRAKGFIDAGQPEVAARMLKTRVSALTEQGRDPGHSAEILQAIESGNIDAANSILRTEIGLAERMKLIAPGGKATERFEDVLDAQGNIIGQRNVVSGELQGNPMAPKPGTLSKQDRIDIARAGRSVNSSVPSSSTVQRSEIYGNGAVLTVLKDGTTQLRDPSGKIVSAEERRDALDVARRSGVVDQYDRSAARASGAQTVEKVGEYAEQLNAIRANVANLDRATEALKNGANTGPIMSMLPSVSQASVQLDNIQRSLGLDVVGASKFGALSEGELNLALSTALPTNLQPDALLKWVEEKRDAQAKLGDYIQGAISFLGQGGTVAEWESMQEKVSDSVRGASTKPPAEMSDEELLKALSK